MRTLIVFWVLLLFAGCGNGTGNQWAESTFGRPAAESLLKESQSGRFTAGGSGPYAVRPWVVLEARLNHPDITRVKEVVFHPINASLTDVGTSAEAVKTLVVVQEHYKFLPNKDGVSERAERDGFLLRLIDRVRL